MTAGESIEARPRSTPKRASPPASGIAPSVDVDVLVAAIAQGDQAAFATLIDLVGPLMTGLVTELVGPRIADQVVHDALIDVWRQAPHPRPIAAHGRSWVVGIAHAHAVERMRIRGEALGSEANRSRRQARLVSCGLTTTEAAVVERAYFGGLLIPEVAAHLGLSEAEVSFHQRAGLRRMRPNES